MPRLRPGAHRVPVYFKPDENFDGGRAFLFPGTLLRLVPELGTRKEASSVSKFRPA
jgi:hypothetical protein